MPRAEKTRQSHAIWFRIAQDSPANADRFLDQFNHTCQLLTEHPRIGRLRSELSPHSPALRSFPFGHYLIFYRPTDNGIEITRVLHGARRLDDVFSR